MMKKEREKALEGDGMHSNMRIYVCMYVRGMYFVWEVRDDILEMEEQSKVGAGGTRVYKFWMPLNLSIIHR